MNFLWQGFGDGGFENENGRRGNGRNGGWCFIFSFFLLQLICLQFHPFFAIVELDEFGQRPVAGRADDDGGHEIRNPQNLLFGPQILGLRRKRFYSLTRICHVIVRLAEADDELTRQVDGSPKEKNKTELEVYVWVM